MLGIVYRSVAKSGRNTTSQSAEKSYFDKDLEVAGFDKYYKEALTYKSQYDSILTTLMDHYWVRNEADIISGNIASLSNFVGSNKRKEDIRETILASLKALKNEDRGSSKAIVILTNNLQGIFPFSMNIVTNYSYVFSTNL